MTSPTPASPLPAVIYATLKKTTAWGDLVGCPPVFMPFGAVTSFCGPVVMGKCFEDNSLAKAAVDDGGLLQMPAGLVRAVDGGASLRRALPSATGTPGPKRCGGANSGRVGLPGDWLCADVDGIVVLPAPLQV